MDGKICLVVGASSGMGRKTAIALAQAGAHVIVSARREDEIAKVVESLTGDGHSAEAIACDGTDPASVDAMMDAIESHHGRLDGVFNALGHIHGFCAFHETPVERWQATMDTNLNSVFYLLRRQVPLVLAAGGGSIVNTSSTAGLGGTETMADYTASKWGLIGLTRTVAREYADRGLRCNVIAPGIIRTEAAQDIEAANPDLFDNLRNSIPARRFGEMDDIADLVLWLLGDGSAYVNGTTIPIDGARSA